MDARILLAENQSLRLGEVYGQLKLPAVWLAVLNGCESGLSLPDRTAVAGQEVRVRPD